MKHFFLCFLLYLLGTQTLKADNKEYLYGVPEKSWSESLGNHRAVLWINKTSDVALLDFLWRRHDLNVNQHSFVIVNALNGDTVRNVNRKEVNNERCCITFGPVREGVYYFYYLSYKSFPDQGWYPYDYYKQEASADTAWLRKIKNMNDPAMAKVTKVEARSAFDSFFPMEIVATKQEVADYKANNIQNLLLFPEDRRYPIRMRDALPLKWMKVSQGETFTGEAMRNEYYAFQIGVAASDIDIKGLTYEASELKFGSNSIPATDITCFNTEGIDPYGNKFTKKLSLKRGEVQPLWFGVDVAENQTPGTYTGTVKIKTDDGLVKEVPVKLTVTDQLLADRGDSEPWRHSRLRWLNSTRGLNDDVVDPYTAMQVKGNRISCLGRSMILDNKTGLPRQIDSWKNEILSAPVHFIVETKSGIKQLNAAPAFKVIKEGKVNWTWEASNAELTLKCDAVMEFDGWINFVYTLTPKQKLEVKDIRLEISMKKEIAQFVMGMGLPGQDTPVSYKGKWDSPESSVNNYGVSIPVSKNEKWQWPFDSFWMGSAHAGIHCELRGSSYSGPLLNLYRPAYPQSWYNEGKGGFEIIQDERTVKSVVYSGARTLENGKPVIFDFAFIVTPVKEIDYKSQFTDRYYHNGNTPVPTDEDVKAGVKIINVHHANEFNPFINYPFLTVDKMKNFTDTWHEKGCKVKIYYTIREITSAVTEIWALRSLGNEVLNSGKGGGYPWLREHFVSDYTPQWYQYFKEPIQGIAADASVLTSFEVSRWYNYYIEGLHWLVQNVGIDGLYLDDVSYDRRILKRMRKVMNEVKPGCIIDLHSNTGFSKGPANQYADYFPYINKLWFGESFMYDQMMPTNWLVESSGIPFGLMGDMLYRGGNKWLGMQYGMTVRHPWMTEGIVCDPRLIWKIWDEFDIKDARMLGFWEKKPAVTTSDKDVKVTAYVKEGRVLLSIGNYSDVVKEITLNIDWKQLGLKKTACRLSAPFIKDFQPQKDFLVADKIKVDPRKGWLIYLYE